MIARTYTPDAPSGPPAAPPCEGEPWRFDEHGAVECLLSVAVPASEPLPPTGSTIPADVILGGVLALVVGVALLRARRSDRRFGARS